MSQQAELLLDGKRTGFRILFTDDGELKFKGKGPKDVFQWVAENEDTGVTVSGLDEVPLLPVRRETFGYYVPIAVDLAASTEGKNYDYIFDELFEDPYLIAPNGEFDSELL